MPGSVITPTCELLKNVARAGEPSKVQGLPRPAGFVLRLHEVEDPGHAVGEGVVVPAQTDELGDVVDGQAARRRRLGRQVGDDRRAPVAGVDVDRHGRVAAPGPPGAGAAIDAAAAAGAGRRAAPAAPGRGAAAGATASAGAAAGAARAAASRTAATCAAAGRPSSGHASAARAAATAAGAGCRAAAAATAVASTPATGSSAAGPPSRPGIPAPAAQPRPITRKARAVERMRECERRQGTTVRLIVSI